MITRVYIDNFRCFSGFEVKPNRVNLLVGNNGAGKSTFIEVLYRVVGLAVMGNSIDDAFPWHSRTRWDSRPTQRIELEISGNGGVYQYSLELLHDLKHQTVSLRQEVVKYDSRTLFAYDGDIVQLHNNDGKLGAQFPYKGTRSFLSQLEERPENTLLRWFLACLGKIWLLKLDPTNINRESLRESDALDADASNFASWYRHLSQERPERLPKLFVRLGEILPGFRTLKTVSIGQHGRKRELVVAFGFGEPETKYEVDFDDLSDGERATIVLYCILMDPDSSERILLLDEPENYVGLHLVQPWLVELADDLRDEGQLFLISHHP